VELTVKQIFCEILRILRRPRAAVVIILNCGFNISCAADTQYSLVINMKVMVVSQVIIDTPVTFVWIFHMDFLYLFGDAFVLSSPAAYFTRNPPVVSRTSHMEQFASSFNGVSCFHMTFFYCRVDTALPYL
jgi:hypothetical protein